MTATLWVSVVIGTISLLAALASSRAAVRAARINTTSSEKNARLDAEKEAYERARKMDLESIARLENENSRLKTRVRDLEVESDANREEIRILRRKILQLEHDVKEE